MSSNEHAEGSADHDPLECLLDAFVYAPIGLLLDGKELVPDLARRGRAQAANARVIGSFALSAADGRVQTAFSDLERQVGVLLRTLAGSVPAAETAVSTSSAPAADPTPKPKSKPTKTPAATGAKKSGARTRPASASKPKAPAVKVSKAKGAKSVIPTVESLAIEGYDTLAASQIASRLDGLTATERAAVAEFEAGNRKRKTILDKIGRLDASGGS